MVMERVISSTRKRSITLVVFMEFFIPLAMANCEKLLVFVTPLSLRNQFSMYTSATLHLLILLSVDMLYGKKTYRPNRVFKTVQKFPLADLLNYCLPLGPVQHARIPEIFEAIETVCIEVALRGDSEVPRMPKTKSIIIRWSW